MITPTTSQHQLTGRSVLVMIVTFFGIIFAANGVLVSAAISTNSGMVANEPYRKGLRYNERIAANDRQSQLGWTDELSMTPRADGLVMVLKDRAGQGLSGLSAVAVIGRPATDREDMTVHLIEQTPGQYLAQFPARAPGAYIASLEVSGSGADPGTIVFRARRRLWVEH